MADQIIEITSPGFHISKSRGFVSVNREKELIGKVAIDDLFAVIISTPSCSITTNVLDVLAHNNIPVVVSGTNFLPSSITLPLTLNINQFHVMNLQASLSEPRRKRAWQQIVRSKIHNQNEVLQRAGIYSSRLKQLVGRVRSGDPDNIEAQAARYYWQSLFGSDFRRDRDQEGLNSALNYAYTVLRACVARGLCAAGLHPAFSLHHMNSRNALNLADDLIEPLRPIADNAVQINRDFFAGALTPECKKVLASLVNIEIDTIDGASPLSLATVKMCRSVVSYYSGETKQIFLPKLPKPLAYNVS